MFDTYRAQIGADKLPSPSPVENLLGQQVIRTICDEYYSVVVDRDFLARAALFEDAQANEADFFGGTIVNLPEPTNDFTYWDSLIEDPDTELKTFVWFAHTNNLRKRRATLESSASVGDCCEFHSIAEGILQQNRLQVTQTDRLLLIRELMLTEVRAITDILQTDHKRIEETRVSTVSKSASQLPFLSSAVADWIEENSPSTWSGERREQCEVTLRDFVSMVGDKPIDDYKKADGRKYKNLLSHLPASWRKLKTTRHLDPVAAAKKAVQLGLQGQHKRTVNKKLGIVSQCWEWIATQYDEVSTNPVRSLKFRDNKSPRNQRDAFTVEDLVTIFSSPIYAGCKSEKYWQQHGTEVLRDSHKFWVPLIGLYSGMRLNEICQLHTNDIRESGGVHFFSINCDSSDKQVKTDSSIRDIPIHPFLIQCGLLGFAKLCGPSDNRLFPEIKAARSGRYSDAFGKHFARHLKSVGVKRPKITFHSFRHTFEDAARNSGVRAEHIDALQGHVSPGMGGRYGEGYNLDTLHREMKKIKFDGLDLNHLQFRHNK